MESSECAPIHYVAELTPQRIESLKAKLLRKGLAQRSINVQLRHLSSIFGMAVKWKILDKNPFREVSKFKSSATPPRYLTKQHIDSLLTIAQQHNTNLYLALLLGVYAGLRKNEIGHARWEWLNFEQKIITLSPHEGFDLKDHECRTIPLHDRLAQALLPERQDEGFIFFPQRKTFKNRYRYDFRNSLTTVCKGVGLEWVTPHILRHTFASQLAIAGVSLYKISQWLGHSDFKTTQIYAHLQAGDEEINLI